MDLKTPISHSILIVRLLSGAAMPARSAAATAGCPAKALICCKAVGGTANRATEPLIGSCKRIITAIDFSLRLRARRRGASLLQEIHERAPVVRPVGQPLEPVHTKQRHIAFINFPSVCGG